MKYSFMSFSSPESNFDDLIKLAVKYGYDGIEPRIDPNHKHGIKPEADKLFLREARKKSADSGVKICCIATSCTFADPLTQAQNIETARNVIVLASEINSPAIRVFGGKIPDNISRETGIELVTDALGKLADFAAANNVTICIETHDSWCNPQHVAIVMRNVNHRAVAVNWDIMHPVLTEGFTVENSFNILKPWIRHVHIHDGYRENGKLIFKPTGEGKVDHDTAVKLLRDSGYKGFISGEWIRWEPCDVHLPREIKTLRGLEKNYN